MSYKHKGQLLAFAEDMMLREAAEWSMRLYNAPDAKAVDLILGAEEWAKMMQVAMREGMSVAEAADATRELSCMHLASGFTATEIIQLLERHWHHGKELAEWHRRAW